MAAQVVQESIFARQSENLSELMPQQAHIMCGNRVPGAGHGGNVIKQVTLGLFNCSKIRNNLGRFHNHFTQQQAAGTDDFADHAHNTHQGMHLRQIPAVGAEFFPDIRHSVQAYDINTLVAQEQHILGHVVENNRICIVQIPLVGIKGCHDDLVCLRAPTEVAGGGGRKDLRNASLILLGNAPVVIEKETVLKFLFACFSSARPDMVFAGVVHYKVQTQRDAAAVTVFCQCFQVFHGAQFGLNAAKIRNGITAVASPGRTFQQRHQMQIIDAAVLNVIQFASDAGKGPGKGVGIHQHTQQIVPLVPGRICDPGTVQLLQCFRALFPAAIQHAAKIIPRLIIPGI